MPKETGKRLRVAKVEADDAVWLALRKESLERNIPLTRLLGSLVEKEVRRYGRATRDRGA
jgi:hypothetical protein